MFERQEHNNDKYKNWTLWPRRPILVLGDSNMGRLPAVEDKRVRLVCHPGAELAHVYNLLRNRTPTSAGVTRVLLSFGINNKGHTSITALEKC